MFYTSFKFLFVLIALLLSCCFLRYVIIQLLFDIQQLYFIDTTFFHWVCWNIFLTMHFLFWCCSWHRTLQTQSDWSLNCLFFTFWAVPMYIWKYWKYAIAPVWWVSSCSEPFRLLVWQTENTTSVQGLSRERSPMGSRFSELLIMDVTGTATEQVRTCGFRKNSPSLDKAPKMRDSVRLCSWESFLETLRSFSLKTWAMYSSAIPGSSVFCDRLFLVFSGVSLETAANFLLFLNVAMILKEKLCQLRRLNWFFNFVPKMLLSFIMRE